MKKNHSKGKIVVDGLSFKSRDSPERKLQDQKVLKAGLRTFDAGCQADDKTKVKRPKKTSDILSRIVKERHEYPATFQASGLSKFTKKFSPAIRNGIVTRVFQRTRLDEFVRSDPDAIKPDLRARINNVIEKSKLGQACSSRPKSAINDEAKRVAIRKDVEACTSRSAIRRPSSDKTLAELKVQEHPTPNFSLKKSASKPAKSHHVSKSSMSKLSRESSNSHLKHATLTTALNDSADLFNLQYKLKTKLDRKIILNFDSFLPIAKSRKDLKLSRKASQKHVIL